MGMIGSILVDYEQDTRKEKDQKIVILVDAKSNTPLLAYHTKNVEEEAKIFTLLDIYMKSTRYQRIPENLKVQRIASYLKEKGHKSTDFEMKEV